MKKPEHFERLNHDFQPENKGRLFFDGKAFCDLSSLNILRCGVDTLRQLYRGNIKPGILEIFEESGLVFFAGYDWHAGRVARDSGYQFKLQNADLGIVMLIKNFNVKPENHGPHLKIEASPHLIDEHPPADLQKFMDGLANEVLDQVQYNQCAVHLALDVQGWIPPADIVARMHCRSRSVRQFDTVADMDFAHTAVTYGRGESYMFGSPSSVQLCIYDKTAQAKATDKLDYWESVWTRNDNPFEDSPENYNPELPVWRIEFRFHHSVVQQFADGTTAKGLDDHFSLGFKCFSALAYHLDGLLQYGFDSFKFLHTPSRFHPVWTIFTQDVRVNVSVSSLLDKTDYKRYYKTSSGFSGKNIELLLGNAISLAARERLTAEQTIKALKSLPFWQTIADYYHDKGMCQITLKEHISRLLKERCIRWGKAI